MAYTGTSIVDYLKSVGQDSSISNRIKLGTQYGIDYSKSTDNYATQNAALLSKLTSGNSTINPAITANIGATPFLQQGTDLSKLTVGTNAVGNIVDLPKINTSINPAILNTVGATPFTSGAMNIPTQDTTQDNSAIEAGIKDAQAKLKAIQDKIASESIAPSSTESLQAGEEVSTYQPPTPTATETYASYTQSMLDTLEAQRKTLEETYKTQLDTINKQRDDAQKKYDELLKKQQDILESADPTKSATYEQEQSIRQNQLDYAETASKTLEENYTANQALVNELGTLLTQISNDLLAEKAITGLESIRNPRIAQATEKATARVGVIEAVMAARNGQINVANTAIDKAQGAVSAARTDQLNYYNSLLNFYDSQAKTEDSKITALTKDEKDIVASQIKLLENDLATTQANADYIKSLMMDPDTAMIVAQSGVTLNDTPQQVQAKFAQYAYIKEVTDMSNKMNTEGYTYLTPEEAKTKDSNLVATTTDSKGNVKYWLRPEKKTTEKTTQTELKDAIDSGLQANNAFEPDGKIAWKSYLWALQNWVNNGGTVSEFYIVYPIGQYLDEGNQTEFYTNTNQQ